MLNLKAKIRKTIGRGVKELRKKGIIPAVLYGPKIENISLEVNSKEFEKVFKEAGESSLVSLNLGSQKFLVLIHALEIDPFSQKPTHIDFYQPRLDEEITVEIPLIFVGEALAVKDLSGTLVKNIQTIEIKALPQNLPHQIEVNIGKLKTFEDAFLVKDLELPERVKVLKNPEEIVAKVTPPEKIEEELVKPIITEEKKEEVKVTGEKKPEIEK